MLWHGYLLFYLLMLLISFVFESKRIEIKFLFKEFLSFVSFRLLSGVVEMLIMYVMIDLLL